MDELSYEETPVLEPVISEPVTAQTVPPPPPVPPVAPPIQPRVAPVQPPQPMSPIVLFLILAVVFGVGVWASSYIRQFLPTSTPTPKQVAVTPTPIPSIPPDPYANWKTYSVISGATHKAIDGVSFKLPPEITDLFCDGPGCASQGTTLPGGTRFTVAARGAGQALTDYRGKIITDFGGKPFVTSITTISGRPAVGFVGDFTGTTVTGYSFTKMRGAMISVTDSLSLEVNHFTPTSNPTADFASDDVLFTKILNSFLFAGLPAPAVPVVSPTTTPTATSSGS